jgi:hypothetical protein
MDLKEIHDRIVLLEDRRQNLYRGRMYMIHELGMRAPTAVLEGGDEFMTKIKKIDEELTKLWAEKRLLLTGSSDGCNLEGGLR